MNRKGLISTPPDSSLLGSVADIISSTFEGHTVKAHILGFEWNLGNDAVTLQDLFDQLGTLHSEEIKFADHNRLVFVGAADKYFTGLFLTAKSHRSFCELKKDRAGSFKIDVRQATAGASLIDFNFFVVHKKTGRGLYQYYHQSCHPSTFSRFCMGEFGEAQEKKMAAEVVAAGGEDALTEKQRAAVEEKYAAMFTHRLLVRPENFTTLLKRFEKIGAFEFNFGTIEPEKEQRFRRFKGVANKLTHRVTFTRDITLTERCKTIVDFIRDEKDVVDASVEGVDADGLTRTLQLMENPDSFGHYEFDALAQNMDFDPEDFMDSMFMKELLRVAGEHKHILEQRAK